MKSLTESDSNYRHIEKMATRDILTAINAEDQAVPRIISAHIASIEAVVERVVGQLQSGGRLFYLGAGTSGRLGILDASECPPTFGVPPDLVVGIIAGGDTAIRRAVEFAEDNPEGGWQDLQKWELSPADFVMGLAASGRTPYVVGALARCQERGIPTACLTCNPGSAITEVADYPIAIPVGPEFITGSTRMKAGTAQKLVLNMISTATMVRLGRVMDNKMVDMELANQKLIERGTRIIMHQSGLSETEARQVLLDKKSVREALNSLNKPH